MEKREREKKSSFFSFFLSFFLSFCRSWLCINDLNAFSWLLLFIPLTKFPAFTRKWAKWRRPMLRPSWTFHDVMAGLLRMDFWDDNPNQHHNYWWIDSFFFSFSVQAGNCCIDKWNGIRNKMKMGKYWVECFSRGQWSPKAASCRG